MKRGFTLVELLAVIVILAVILVIAVPQITNVINQTKKNSLASTAKIIAAKAEEATVENEILESNEALTCANLVKLDDNYGSCSVSMVNGKGTVTLVGTGKFAGITCTGTKDNMTCTEGSSTPEYVYSYGEPYYEYTYVVKNYDACMPFVKQRNINDGYNETDAETISTRVCNNGSDVYSDGYGTERDTSASEWFAFEINWDRFTYEDVSSFVDRSDTPNLINAPVSDYTTLKYLYTNTQAKVFLRWLSTTVNFDENDARDVCVLKNNNLVCFETSGNVYSTNVEKAQSLFGASNCEVIPSEWGPSYPDYLACSDGNYGCGIYDPNSVTCGETGISYCNKTGCCGPGESCD